MTEREAYERLARTPGCSSQTVGKLLKRGYGILDVAHRLEQAVGEPSKSPYLTPACPGYPALLAELDDRPLRLFHRGKDLARMSAHCVAVVGSRKASRYGMAWAKRLGATLASNGITVCSGLALGIDAAAHRGALEAVGNCPAAAVPAVVLGHGWEHIYPQENRVLRHQMEEHGIILSEYEPAHPPSRWTFPARNRIIAGMCQTVVIVEAGPRSGSLHTARFANEAGRDVWVVPNRPGTLNSQGVLSLLADGAIPMDDIDRFTSELVEELNVTYPQRRALPNLSPELLEVLGAMAEGEERPSRLAQSLGRPIALLAAQLSELELLGLAERLADGSWSLLCWDILEQLLESYPEAAFEGAA